MSRFKRTNRFWMDVLGIALVAGLASGCGTVFTVSPGGDASAGDAANGDAANGDAANGGTDAATGHDDMPTSSDAGPIGSASNALALDKVGGATAAYGLRKLSSTYAGALVNITRASDSASEDVSPSSDDEFPSAAVAAWSQGGTIHVVKWYDQSGNHYDITNTVQAGAPTLTLAAYRTRPGVTFSESSKNYLGASFPWVTGNGSWSGSVSVLGDVSSTGFYQPLFYYGKIGNTNAISMNTQLSGTFDWGITCFGTDYPSTIPTTAPAAFTASYDGTTYTGNVNGSSFDGTNTSGQDLDTTTFWMGGSPTESGIWLNGSIGALIIYPTNLTPSQLSTLQSVEKSYYGF